MCLTLIKLVGHKKVEEHEPGREGKGDQGAWGWVNKGEMGVTVIKIYYIQL